MNKEQKAKRIINTWTGPIESKILPKLALALPDTINPDHLTILGILATIIIFLGYVLVWYSKLWLLLSIFGFILHWYADSLDGTLARVRHTERERYGYFVDHICDAWATVFICIGIGLSPLMQIESALFLAVGYLLLNIYSHISAYTDRIFRLSFLKIGPTEIRILLIIINFILIFWNPVIIKFEEESLSMVDLGALIIFGVFCFVFIGTSIKTAIRLNQEEKQV